MSDRVGALWSKVRTCVLTSGPETLGLLYNMTSHLLNRPNLLLTGSLSDYPHHVISHRKRHLNQQQPCCVFNKVLNLDKLSLFSKQSQLLSIVCLLRQKQDCCSVDNSQDVNSCVPCSMLQKIQFIQTLVNQHCTDAMAIADPSLSACVKLKQSPRHLAYLHLVW